MYVNNFVLGIELIVSRSFRSITTLEGESVTLSCSSSIMQLPFTWLHNGEDIVTGSVTFSPPVFNQNLIIKNALHFHSGVYTCIVTANGRTAEQNINVTIVPGTMYTIITEIQIYTLHNSVHKNSRI